VHLDLDLRASLNVVRAGRPDPHEKDIDDAMAASTRCPALTA